MGGLAPSPQNRILGLYKPSPPTRTNGKSTGTHTRILEPAQAGFVCIAAFQPPGARYELRNIFIHRPQLPQSQSR